MNIERKFHNYKNWECFGQGMYETTCFMDKYAMINDCELLLSCPEWLWESMTFVTHHWLTSSEQHLTNMSRNRKAFLGQAACCFSHGAPEYLTKLAWFNLDEKTQKKANEVASEVIKDWEEKYLMGYFDA